MQCDYMAIILECVMFAADTCKSNDCSINWKDVTLMLIDEIVTSANEQIEHFYRL